MAKQRTKKLPTKQKVVKGKSIFDHLKALTQDGNEDYWNVISEADRKTFSPYMNNRLLSMNPDWIEFVNDFQRYTIGLLKPRDVFRMFYDILPKGRFFFPYVKANETRPIPDEMARILRLYYEISEHEVGEYYKILLKTTEGKIQLRQIIDMYGLQSKEKRQLYKECGL